MSVAAQPEPTAADAAKRSAWKSVAIPTEHGGWGLTLEPALLGLVVAFSWPGLAIGVAALVAFLARTPLKLALVDRRRHRDLPRTRLATKVAVIELTAVAALGVSALSAAGWQWLIPVAIALPAVAVELWFDIRSRSRRLIPELAGSIAISSVAAAIVLADDGSARLAVAIWMVLAGRVIASIPFIRTQIVRLRHDTAPLRSTDALQVAGVLVAGAAVRVDTQVVGGAVAVAVLAIAQSFWLRRSPVPPAKVLGLRQMALGFAVVAATAVSVLLIS